MAQRGFKCSVQESISLGGTCSGEVTVWVDAAAVEYGGADFIIAEFVIARAKEQSHRQVGPFGPSDDIACYNVQVLEEVAASASQTEL